MNANVIEVLERMLDALDLVIQGEQRRVGSVEGQRAAGVAHAARTALSQLQALREVG